VSAVLEARDLARWYGQVVGLNDLTVQVGAGVTGLLGPNGAGKSTFLKLVAGELRPSRGTIHVLGEQPFGNRGLFRRIGFVPQQDAFYRDMTGRKFVTFLMRLAGYSGAEANARGASALEVVKMTPHADRRISGYSKGMRQRVKIAQAIAHDPELLILDEPLTGLDPLGRREMINLFRTLGEGGMHVITSSHVLHEVEAITERIVLIHRGRLLAQGTVAELRVLLNRYPRKVTVEAGRARPLAQALLGLDEVLSVGLGDDEQQLAIETRDLDAFFTHLTELAASEPYGIRAMESSDAGLEALFDYLVG
jgi:ABC-2 type transport system ATP-binding protein